MKIAYIFIGVAMCVGAGLLFFVLVPITCWDAAMPSPGRPAVESSSGCSRLKTLEMRFMKADVPVAPPIAQPTFNGEYEIYDDGVVIFQYPSDWKLMTGKEFDQKYSGMSADAVYVISPNAIVEVTIEGIVKNGYVLQVIRGEEASVRTMETIRQEPEGYGDLIEEITVDGRHFILYDFGWEGLSVRAENTTPGLGLYFVMYTEDNTSNEVWSLMREMVSSVEIR